jgi:4-hydroxy-3-polyprenylbenzoate decarboxylase
VLVENTPIDYLDFASPASRPGSKMGLRTPLTNGLGKPSANGAVQLRRIRAVTARIDEIWDELAIFPDDK